MNLDMSFQRKGVRVEIVEKKKANRQLVQRASSFLDHLSSFDDSFRRYQKNGLSVCLESGRGDSLSCSMKLYIRKLLKMNMEGFYGSDWPFQAKAKRQEMSSPDAHYLFVRACDQIAGFVHYRFTLEEEIPVLYLYELQLESHIQGKGLGEFLMHLIDLIASKTRMAAILLTVQTSNALAMTFYMSKLGYRISSISPSKSIFRTFSANYEILCKTFDSQAKSVLENYQEPIEYQA